MEKKVRSHSVQSALPVFCSGRCGVKNRERMARLGGLVHGPAEGDLLEVGVVGLGLGLQVNAEQRFYFLGALAFLPAFPHLYEPCGM